MYSFVKANIKIIYLLLLNKSYTTFIKCRFVEMKMIDFTKCKQVTSKITSGKFN